MELLTYIFLGETTFLRTASGVVKSEVIIPRISGIAQKHMPEKEQTKATKKLSS
jgi:hypothetical protein